MNGSDRPAAGLKARPARRDPKLEEIAAHLAELGRRFDGRGWVLGTSGNFSAVVARNPLRLAMTASSVHKGYLTPELVLEVGPGGTSAGRGSRPSAESLLHLEIVRARGAGAVLHTHSIWSTILSDLHARSGGLEIAGYEMLKGLEGVRTHEHREWIPILENDQDMRRLAQKVARTLRRTPAAHGFLLRRHGLYTWGTDLTQAARHVEIFEFLLEAIGRSLELKRRDRGRTRKGNDQASHEEQSTKNRTKK